jgi:hypothetical protein
MILYSKQESNSEANVFVNIGSDSIYVILSFI